MGWDDVDDLPMLQITPDPAAQPRQTFDRTSLAYTPTSMRAAASRIIGKAYKRSEIRQAADDLKTWIDAMKAALPVLS